LGATPGGTITFLFTDIEGSTKLWESHPADMKVALARHDRILRDCIESSRGYVFKTVGDAFCAAFDTALDAMNAALQSQAGLLAAQWEVPGGIRVRMALHTGTAEERDGDYFGQTLNRVARLLSIGYGGQTLVSLVTEELLRDLLPAGVSLLDLGAHRLKDLLRPEKVFQLAAPGLRSEFPAIRSLESHPNNLPLQPTPFIGRERELATVEGLLSAGEVRVISLVGIGGTGKSRLGLQVAADVIEQYPDGVYFVDLSAVDSAAYVIPMIAATLGLREAGSRSLRELLFEALRGRRTLLVLDNFEQVLSGAAHVVELLGVSPHLKIIVTSREALHIRAERVFRVPPLSVPKLREAREMPAARLTQYEAVRLFIERAVAVSPDFLVTNENAPAVSEICSRLDGLPLAIELAAARVTILAPRDILERLGGRLKLLSAGAADLPFRQRTLRAAIDWSYRILTPAEQRLFRDMASFSGGCTIEAMEAVCGCVEEPGSAVEMLASLVEKSLICLDERGSGKRFGMFESLRVYGLELIEKDGLTGVMKEAHARYFLDLAERTAAGLDGPEQLAALDSLEAEQDNLRAALDWAHEQPGRDSELRLCAALGGFWQARGLLTEGLELCRRALGRTSRPAGPEESQGWARTTMYRGVLEREVGEYETAAAAIESAHAVFCGAADSEWTCRSLNELGLTLYRAGGDARARDCFDAVLAKGKEAGAANRARAENGLGALAERAGRFDEARGRFETAISAFTSLGNDRLRSHALMNLANALSEMGDHRRALELSEEATAVAEKLGDAPYLALAWNNRGCYHSLLGQHEQARTCYETLERVARFTGNQRWRALALAGLGDALAALGDAGGAMEAALGATSVSEKLGLDLELGTSLRVLGEVYLAQGRKPEAEDCFARAIPILQKFFHGENTEELIRAQRGLASSMDAMKGE
jgi:predicted ATPase/class 3 adenylate cyclase